MASRSPLGRSARLPLSFRSTEPEYAPLQRTADKISLSFEQECRRDVLLTEQTRMLEEELRRRKDATPPPLTAAGEDRRLQLRVVALSHELHLATTALAETQTCNRRLKRHIDTCRQDLGTLNAAISSWKADLEQISYAAVKANANLCSANFSSLRCKTASAQLRSKSLQDRMKQSRRLAELTAEVREDQIHSPTFLTSPDDLPSPTRRNTDFADPLPIQRALLRKWHQVRSTQAVHSSKSQLDHYIRHVKLLNTAFTALTTASCIRDLEELVSVVVKSEEQHYNQHSLLLLRTAEAEILSEELQSATSAINRLQSAQFLNESQAKALISKLNSQIQDQCTAQKFKQRDLSCLQSVLSNTFQVIKDLPGADLDAQITEKSVLGRLAEAELVLFEQVRSRKPGVMRGRREMTPLCVKSALAETLLEEEEVGPMTEQQIRSRVKALFTPQGNKRPLLL